MSALERCGYHLSCWLSTPRAWHRVDGPGGREALACLRVGDVLLVEGSSRLSTVIKYLTQSCWSHAALFVGPVAAQRAGGPPGSAFIEADLVDGVRLVGPGEFADYPLRVCRPVGLTDDAIERLVTHLLRRVGHRYDLRNILDLARYLLPLPPVPARFRRDMLSLGSGDPTRAICSTLIAEAFQAIRYPILPILEPGPQGAGAESTVYRRRHPTLFTPRDFDLSPYFQIVKPKLTSDFDPGRLHWQATARDVVNG